jgi:hypothetical protein
MREGLEAPLRSSALDESCADILGVVKVSIKTRTVTVEGPRGTNISHPHRQHHDDPEADLNCWMGTLALALTQEF